MKRIVRIVVVSVLLLAALVAGGSLYMLYNVDPVKKEIAESWPNSLDDTCAREEWGWRPEWDLSRMTDDMLAHIRAKLGAE